MLRVAGVALVVVFFAGFERAHALAFAQHERLAITRKREPIDLLDQRLAVRGSEIEALEPPRFLRVSATPMRARDIEHRPQRLP